MGDRVIDPTVIISPIHYTPAQRWKMFLAVASNFENRSTSNPSSILARHWSRTQPPTGLCESVNDIPSFFGG
jgi:hypothetical protein